MTIMPRYKRTTVKTQGNLRVSIVNILSIAYLQRHSFYWFWNLMYLPVQVTKPSEQWYGNKRVKNVLI